MPTTVTTKVPATVPAMRCIASTVTITVNGSDFALQK